MNMLQILKNLRLRLFLGLCCWLIGVMCAFVFIYASNETTSRTRVQALHTYKEVSLFPVIRGHISFVNAFQKIFLTNVAVGITVSVIGFLTGGLATTAIFIWNGFTLGLVTSKLILVKQDTEVLVNALLWHGPFEMFALIWLGAYGFSGWKFIHEVFSTNDSAWSFGLPRFSEFLIPIGLLFLAALIEATLISLS